MTRLVSLLMAPHIPHESPDHDDGHASCSSHSPATHGASPARDLLLATANPHKIEELRAIFSTLGLTHVRLRSLADFGSTLEPAETGSTFEANATIKALSYAQQTRQYALADDSGLEIDALHGRPGVISSHYATNGVETGVSRAQRDQANNLRVLRELEGSSQRSARFVCVMALASPPVDDQPSRLLHVVRGTFEGAIGVPPRVPVGADGFGYDPLFLVPPDFTRSSAQLTPDIKNRMSHRGAAVRAMAQWLCRHSW